MMTETEIKNIELLCGAATQSPWVTDLKNNNWIISCGDIDNFHLLATLITKPGLNSQNDAKFIAESRQIIPKLINEISRLKEINRSLTKGQPIEGGWE